MTAPRHSAEIARWTAEPLAPEVERAVRRLAATEDVVRLAVLPDVHLAQDVCVGVAVASEQLLFPAAVGGDIGCGMAALRFDADVELLADRRNVARLMTRLYQRIPINKHGPDADPQWPLGDGLSHPALAKRRPSQSAAPGTAACSSAHSAAATTSSSSRATRRAASGSWCTAARGPWARRSGPIT